MENKNNSHGNSQWKSNLLVYVHDLVYFAAAILVVFLLLFRIIVVSGDSMYNTLVNGDYLLLAGNLIYTKPEQGDIIVISKASFDNGAPIIKRVIATEGQVVDIDFEAGLVYVDGVVLEEDYVYTPTNVFEGMQFPLTVSQGCVFALGDNRNESKDSRSPQIGQIDIREILGKAVFLMIPAADYRAGDTTPDFSRIGAIK